MADRKTEGSMSRVNSKAKKDIRQDQLERGTTGGKSVNGKRTRSVNSKRTKSINGSRLSKSVNGKRTRSKSTRGRRTKSISGSGSSKSIIGSGSSKSVPSKRTRSVNGKSVNSIHSSSQAKGRKVVISTDKHGVQPENKEVNSMFINRELTPSETKAIDEKINKILSEMDQELKSFVGNKPNAYVWLIMRGNSYVPGLCVSMHTMREQSPDADLVVLYTEDVTQLDEIKTIADFVIKVPYISTECLKLKEAKQNSAYIPWIESSFTKWTCLALNYKKVFFIDADIIITKNIDDIFELKAPAACFASLHARPVGSLPNLYRGKKGRDGYLIHGEPVDYQTAIRSIKSRAPILCASSVLLEPGMPIFKAFLEWLLRVVPFGVPNCVNGYDEQSIYLFYALKKTTWINIHHRYNMFIGKNNYLAKGDFPKIIHYYTVPKPWGRKCDEYEDIVTWYHAAIRMIKKYKFKPAVVSIDSEELEKASELPDTYLPKFRK